MQYFIFNVEARSCPMHGKDPIYKPNGMFKKNLDMTQQEQFTKALNEPTVAQKP